MWVRYLHHLSTHFPIVMSFVLAIVGWWYVRRSDQLLATFLRWGGWATALLTTAAMASGVLSTPESWIADGTDALSHHRNLGLLVWAVVVLAASVFELGIQHQRLDVRKLGALLWSVCALAVLGAGHWGGSMMHSDRVPWQGTEPILGYHTETSVKEQEPLAPASNTTER